MKISFIVPVYNKDIETVKRSVGSLVRQSHKDKEIIVVFDGPQPSVEQALKTEFKSLIYKTIEHEGACAARNSGYAEATGDIISFWDADCVAEPEMSATWLKYIAYYKVDFVYSGYKWDNPDVPGFASERFDPFTLSKYNYISSMGACKKEFVAEWDTSLKGLQDWDYWRQVVKAGAKGYHIPGFGFTTALSKEGDISHTTRKDIESRLKSIRKKWKDPVCDTLVISNTYHFQAVEFAKVLGADYFSNLAYYKLHNYKTLFSVGLDAENPFQSMFFMQDKKATRKVIYWMGMDIDHFLNSAYETVKTLLEQLKVNKIAHFCDDKQGKDKLKRLGIDAEIAPMPVQNHAFATPELPAEFKILAFADEHYAPLLNSIKKALPNLKWELVVPDKRYQLADYTVNVQFSKDKRFIAGLRNMLLAGRHVISTVQEPFCGYVSTDQGVKEFKAEVINKLLTLAKKPAINAPAIEYYRKQTNPETFRKTVGGV